MISWNPDELLQPLAGDQPAGEDLEYSPLLAGFDAYRLFGQATPPEEPPDWSEIRKQALVALEKTRDFRLLAHLAAAVLRTDGLAAFADTLDVAAGWLDTLWPHAYPLASDDVMMRRNALSAFADSMAMVEGLRRLPLVRGRHGTVTLRDMDIASGAMAAGEKDQRLDEAQIAAAFSELTDDDLVRSHEGAVRGVDALDRIEKAMLERGGIEGVPDLSRLRPVLVRIERLFRQHLAGRRGAAEVASEGLATGGAEGAAVPVGSIRSRQDAIRALDAVAEYFRRNEPSSPIPLFVDRAKRLVAKDFLEVLADIAPDALAQARVAGGVPQPE